MNKLNLSDSREAYLVAEAMVGCYEKPKPEKPMFNGDFDKYYSALKCDGV